MSKHLTGIAASPGIAIGNILILEEDLSYEKKNIKNVEIEKKRFHQALEVSKEQIMSLKNKIEEDMGKEQADIFQAHIMILEDPEFISKVENKIERKKINVEVVLEQVIKNYSTKFSEMENEYMQERATDVQDVGKRILKNLLGMNDSSLNELNKNVILFAKNLTPSDTAQIDKSQLLGLVTQTGGKTSHVAIMARSLEVPAVVGVNQSIDSIEPDSKIIVDGIKGSIIINPNEKEIAEYEYKAKKYDQRREKLSKLKDLPAKTRDDSRVELAANIGTPKDVDSVLKNGAESVGLYRTEFLYMDRSSLPTEEEQFKAYKKVAQKLEGSVKIRTLDIGGDKELTYLDLPEELNPFLGYRAIRISLDKTSIFRTQLRAILRASIYGEVKIMYPMISSVEQLTKANEILEEEKIKLREEGIDFDEKIEVGIMVEVPSVAIIADILAKETDFFSIGTNDLIQYTTATDRMNKNISHLYQPFHPAILRLIKKIVDAAHKENIQVSMCGEMAGNKELTPFLLGIGLDEFSMSPSSILGVKETIRNLNLEQARNLAKKTMTITTAKKVKKFCKKTIETL